MINQHIAPPNDDIASAPYWDSLRRHKMELQACDSCERRRFPVAPTCPYCASPRSRWVAPDGAGEIYSFIVVHRTFDPAFEDALPYTIATVDLDGGGRIVARMDQKPAICDRVKAKYIDHQEWTELRFVRIAA